MNNKLTLLGVILCFALCSAKVTSKRSLIVSTEAPQEDKAEEKNEPKKDVTPVIPKIYEMRVDTNVSNRYAKTLITSKVRNLSPNAQEATFSIVTPDKAFISGFTMEIDGKKYEAYVQEKEEAKQTYDQAVSSGQSAAHVAVSARDSNRFTVSVNVEPESKAIFYLRYEELLARKNEKYELVLNIHPGQPVKDLDVQVNIIESRPLKFVKAPSLRSGNEISKNKPNIDPEADIKTLNETSAVVIFKPDVIKQKLFASSLGGKEENGLSGQFVVQYDVVRDPQGGEVLVDGGYFVHFFAPEDLPPLKKQVIFVLDTSGSMSGVRITQLKEAMNSILGELKPEDVFSIVEFNSIVNVWNVPAVRVIYREGDDPYRYYGSAVTETPKEQLDQVIPPSFDASADNIKHAKEVIQKLDAFGGTDIQSALKVGLQIVASNKDPKSHQPIIVFLTDGEPTVGEFNTEKITSTITELNVKKVPVFCLSFGDGADREFLQKLSLKNQGFARHIYEAADAYLQLEDFYKQISSPLLSDVSFKYVDNVKNVSRTHFPILFGGSELYITGVIADPGGFLPPAVEGWGVHGPVTLQPKVYQAAGSLERLWAYLTVKQLLEQRDVAEDKKGPTQEALKLALKYSFVTDVSSLVVVKPNATSAVNTEDAAKTDRNYAYGGFPAIPLSGAPGASFALASPQAPPIYHSISASSGSGGRGAPKYRSRLRTGYSALNQGAFSADSLKGSSYPGDSASNLGVSWSAVAMKGSSYSGYPASNQQGGWSAAGMPGFPGTASYYSMSSGYSNWQVNALQGMPGPPQYYGRIVPASGSPLLLSVDSSSRVQQGMLYPASFDFDSDPMDRIVGGSFGPTLGFGGGGIYNKGHVLTTPLYPSYAPVHVVNDPIFEKVAETTEASVDIFSEILWLKDALNENGTLTLESGTYSLGLNETVSTVPECQNSLNNASGLCKLLQECPQIHKELTDLSTYKKHFCEVQSLAAVCCPVSSTATKGN